VATAAVTASVLKSIIINPSLVGIIMSIIPCTIMDGADKIWVENEVGGMDVCEKRWLRL